LSKHPPAPYFKGRPNLDRILLECNRPLEDKKKTQESHAKEVGVGNPSEERASS
jgi:hypothetical protein